MSTKLDARQTVSRDVLDQLASAAGVELDNLLRSLNSNDTPPLKMSVTGTDRVVSVGSIFVTNPETSKNRTIPTISNTLPSFTSGTITAAATGAGNLVYSPSIASPTAIGMVASQFRKFSINLDAAGNLTVIRGTAGASLAAATAPPSINNTFGIGYFVLRTDAGNNIANVLTSDLYQYVGGGGGGGAGDTTDIIETLKNTLGQSTYNLVTPNIFATNEDDLIDAVASTGSYNLVNSSYSLAEWAGDTWAGHSATAANNWSSIAWSPKLKLFVATSQGGSPSAMYSSDGISWTSATIPVGSWISVVWSPELEIFCTVDYNSARVATSSDGITWVANAVPQNNQWNCITWSPELGLFCAVSNSGTNRVMTSPNGVDWTSRVAAAANVWISVTWSPQLRLFCAVSNNGANRVMTSSDGISWTSQLAAEANNWLGITWSPELGIFCAVSNDGTNRVMTSSDGTTWTPRLASALSGWSAISWSPELGIFCAVALIGANRVMTSPNGITWTSQTASEANIWYGITWSPELLKFVAVANDGTNRVMSSYSNHMTSTQMLDQQEFLNEGKALNTVDITSFWLPASKPTRAVHQISRDGGNSWQHVPSTRVGNNTNVFTGSVSLDNVEQSAQLYGQAATDATVQLGTTGSLERISQQFTVVGTDVIRRIGINGYLRTNTWTQATSIWAGSSVQGVTYGNGLYVAVAIAGKIAYSTDGITWTLAATPSFAGTDIYGVKFGNGKFVAVGVSGKLAYSTDGNIWTQATSVFAGDSVNDATYGGGRYIAVSNNNKIAYSIDGITWTLAATPSFGGSNILGVSYGNGRYMAVGASGKIASSTDGDTWTQVTTTGFGISEVAGIAYGNGVYVATGNSNKIRYSTDFVTWTSASTLITGGSFVYTVTYANGRFIAVGDPGKIGYSIDGNTWITATSPGFASSFLYDVVHANGVHIVVGDAGKIGYLNFTGEVHGAIVRDVAGLPSTNPNDIIAQAVPINRSTVYDTSRFDFDFSYAPITAGIYHFIAYGDNAFNTAATASTNTYTIQSNSTGDGYGFYNGTVWADSGTVSLKYGIDGFELDARVRISSNTAATEVIGYGMFYDQEVLTTGGAILNYDAKQFKAVANNFNEFDINFMPDPQLLTVYYVQGGQAFKYGAFSLQGNKVIFPANSFNNNAVEADVTLVFDQSGRGSYDSSDVNAALLAANSLGSTNASIDRSTPGRGIFLRRPDGTLREVALDDSDNIVIYSV